MRSTDATEWLTNLAENKNSLKLWVIKYLLFLIMFTKLNKNLLNLMAANMLSMPKTLTILAANFSGFTVADTYRVGLLIF